MRNLLLVLFGFTLFATSCNRHKATYVFITVHDPEGQGVAGANVRLYGKPSDPSISKVVSIDMNQTTQGNGRTSFDLTDHYKNGMAGLAVLDITVTKDTTSVESIIKVEEETNNEATVILP